MSDLTAGQATAWKELCEHILELDTLASIDGMLGWDQQVSMGANAAAGRGAQRALLGGMLHTRSNDARVPKWLDTLEAAELNPIQRRTVVNMRREHDRSKRVSGELATAIAKASAEGFSAWNEAKKARHFTQYAPFLQRNLDLARQRSEAIDAHRHPYDVTLEVYDLGTTIASLRPMFARLQQELTTLLGAITGSGVATAEPFTRSLHADTQLRMHREVIAAIGYDESRGGIGLAPHPFSCRVSPTDVRVATRLHERDILGGLAATMHEAGHALYEQGLPSGDGGSAVHAACSTGVHESQSRLWENQIGRGLPFYRWLSPILSRHLGGSDVLDPEALYRASNRVAPSAIRVSADEVTYNLHVIVRFEIEVALFEGTLQAVDVPNAWNERMQQYLGVTPQDDAEGALQDAHWSAGAFGYFPSYTLGNLYAASLYGLLREAQPELDTAVAAGTFAPTLAFLRDTIHRHGRLLDPPELMRQAVGDRDHVTDLIAYLSARHGKLHGI